MFVRDDSSSCAKSFCSYSNDDDDAPADDDDDDDDATHCTQPAPPPPPTLIRCLCQANFISHDHHRHQSGNLELSARLAYTGKFISGFGAASRGFVYMQHKHTALRCTGLWRRQLSHIAQLDSSRKYDVNRVSNLGRKKDDSAISRLVSNYCTLMGLASVIQSSRIL